MCKNKIHTVIFDKNEFKVYDIILVIYYRHGLLKV